MGASHVAFVASITVAVGVAAAAAQSMDSGLVAPGATLQKVADGFAFTEGPTPDTEGNIFFSDIPNNRIHKWSVAGELSTVREDSGGTNGSLFDAAGNLVSCEGTA